MVGADEGGGVAVFGAAQAVAAVAADVQEGVDFALAVAGDQHRVLAHVGGHEIAGLGICVSWQRKSQQRAKMFSSSSW